MTGNKVAGASRYCVGDHFAISEMTEESGVGRGVTVVYMGY